MNSIGIVGLGKLGASMLAAIAKGQFTVMGMDVNPKTVDLINRGVAPVEETNLQEFMTKNIDRYFATTEMERVVESSYIIFVIVPTPSMDDGSFSLKYAKQAFKEIGKCLKNKEGFTTIVLSSTVEPGSVRYGLLPILEKESGKKCGKDFGLCYSPEFIALGSVIHNFLNPDFSLIGEFDKKSGDILEQFYSELLENNAPCKRMSIENAELTKIALNTYITTKITYANMLAELCEKIPGGDIDIVTDAIGSDSRVGKKYLKGGIGFGGPCFPRDNNALSYLENQLLKLDNADSLPCLVDSYNRYLPDLIVDKISEHVKPYSTIAVLGLTYKQDSPVIDESQGYYICEELINRGYKVIGYDSFAEKLNIQEIAGEKFFLFYDLKACLSMADIVLVTLPDKEFLKIDKTYFKNPVIVFDFWRLLKNELSGKDGITYIPIGCSINDEENGMLLRNIWGNE